MNAEITGIKRVQELEAFRQQDSILCNSVVRQKKRKEMDSRAQLVRVESEDVCLSKWN